jgi:hypothetical protein
MGIFEDVTSLRQAEGEPALEASVEKVVEQLHDPGNLLWAAGIAHSPLERLSI